MNPDVTKNITSHMSELQLQFLQHLKIQPLQIDLTAPGFQSVEPESALHAPYTVSQAIPEIDKPESMPVPEAVVAGNAGSNSLIPDTAPRWLLADTDMPLVQDMLVLLQQYGQTAQWYFQAGCSQISLTDAGFFSAAPELYLDAKLKKQLWCELYQQLPADELTDSELI